MESERRILVVIGAGGHGRALAELAGLAGWQVVGFLDAAPQALHPGRLPVWAEDTTPRGGVPSLPGGANAVALGIGDNAARRDAARRYAGWHQPPLVHPTASVSPSASIGEGAVVFPGAVVHTGASIGPAVVVNTSAVVEHDCRVGDGAHVAPGAVLCGGVRVGAGALVGAGAVVLPGVEVGEDAVIGAGSVVTTPVAAGKTVAGNPARSTDSRA